MARRPTIADVAKLAGVSRATVSFVLNNRPGVAADTQHRVRSAAEELGWTPSSSARALSTGRVRAVGLVLAREPELIGTDPFFPAFMAGIETVISETGDGLMLQMSRPENEVDTYRRLAADRRVDGVLLTDLRTDDPRPALIGELGLPAVAVGAGAGTGLPTVNLDDRPAVREAVHHLAGLGHRDIAYVAGPEEFVHARRRRQAWSAALAEAGLPEGTLLPGGFTAEGGARATRMLLDRPVPPTAIVYGNDLSATAGMAVAQDAGLRLPEDLSVVGFDDVPLASYTNPPLTTCRANPVSWGRASAQALVELIETGTTADVELEPAALVVRASSGPAPVR
ncbi:DNA-binding LacI/PurR family transcriptional regulator [Streptomyces sp. SAI-135]|jgi:DNA-binding LacI/PurR family transcriptional regulator|uniref:LacI family DNA-binding transcriptional regulator n=1 Tax=unclassified Streptomyces TaxID=2593676 RepID=UPI0024737D3D|nr:MULTISPECIES: LacI family DNA-binding transcriptional regulator [unclassified Streptomyces]MDH6521777.1 DNA-binding LacI/PurR family transcriptional regulator [Streptomyces sp. SAI-090]MDH6581866.1 DNA-binding LacI/PurR family transcriptional regulator [Streptomyces sp. SAI-133]MDH6614123.1 DNA-binding LacI/PurR family transcriptional regulator [Streptomyces sp. SAI-135]